MKKTKSIFQMEATECGAASLGMVFSYHEKYVTLEKLRIECGVSRDGSSISDLSKVASEYGFIPRILAIKELENLKKVNLPAILFWKFNHFVVLEGIKGKNYYLNDPAYGHRVVSFEEFNEDFTGVVLEIIPGLEYKKSGEKPKFLNNLKRFMTNKRLGFLFVGIASLFFIIPGIIIPLLVKFFTDKILLNHQYKYMAFLFVLMLFMALIQFSLKWCQDFYLMHWNINLSIINTSKFFNHLVRLPIKFFEQRNPGELQVRLQYIDNITNFFTQNLLTTLLDCSMIFFFVIVMLMYNAFLTFVLILITVINFLVLIGVSYYRRELQQKIMQENGKVQACSMYGLKGIETIKSMGTEDDFFEKYASYQTEYVNTKQRLGFSSQFLYACPQFLTSFSIIVILVLGCFEIMNNQMSIGTLLAFQMLMASFMAPISRLVNFGDYLQYMDSTLKRLNDVYNYPQDSFFNKNAPTNIDIVKLNGEIELKNISFKYNKTKEPFIKNFNLKIYKGQHVALIGKTGNGKSTIAKILTGLYKTDSGDLFFDKFNINELNQKILANSISMVTQNINLFSGSLLENISMFNDEINEKDVINACKISMIHDDIMKLENGYYSLVEEGGKNFSGGQRQRIIIAREIVKKPSILILDEATSSLDPIFEMEIIENLKKNKYTLIIITHRLSAFKDSDNIIILKKGEILASGKHKELLENEYYNELIKLD